METTKLILDHIDKYALVISQKVSAIAPQVMAMVKQRIIAEFTVSIIGLGISIIIFISAILFGKYKIKKHNLAGFRELNEGEALIAISLITIGCIGIIAFTVATSVNGLNVM